MKPIFSSFIWAGFECTSCLTRHRRLDMIHETRHDELVREDYRRIKNYGMKTVREGFAWSRIDRGNGLYDFSYYDEIMRTGREEGVQQIWDLNHFDYPERLDPLSPLFIDAFTQYGLQAIRYLRRFISGPLVVSPINEISFFSWVAADRGHWAPFLKGQGNGLLLKKNLAAAVISFAKTVKSIDKEIFLLHTDPLMRREAKEPSHRVAREHVAAFNEIIRYESWDILMGKKFRELGGDPSVVDYIGINYYLHNQEFVLSKKHGNIGHIAMPFMSKSRIPFGEMIREVYGRYGKPIIISETGSFGRNRKKWWNRIFSEIENEMGRGTPIEGVCAYPVLDRPDSSGFLFPKSGLWDFDQKDISLTRIPHKGTLTLVREHQFPATGISKK